MFVGKARTYPNEAPFRCSTLGLAPGLALKQYTRLERLARDKHPGLLQKFVSYGRKKFYNIGLWSFERSFLTPNLTETYLGFQLFRTLASTSQ